MSQKWYRDQHFHMFLTHCHLLTSHFVTIQGHNLYPNLAKYAILKNCNLRHYPTIICGLGHKLFHANQAKMCPHAGPHHQAYQCKWSCPKSVFWLIFGWGGCCSHRMQLFTTTLLSTLLGLPMQLPALTFVVPCLPTVVALYSSFPRLARLLLYCAQHHGSRALVTRVTVLTHILGVLPSTRIERPLPRASLCPIQRLFSSLSK